MLPLMMLILLAVDRYADGGEEYAPPKTIDAHKARQRLFDIISCKIISQQDCAKQTGATRKGQKSIPETGREGRVSGSYRI